MSKRIIQLFLVLLFFAFPGCSLKTIASSYLQETMAKTAEKLQESPNAYLIERALPAFIVLLDSSVADNPEDISLLQQAAKLHTAYAISFAEPVNPAWARLHYQQAKQYMENAWKLKYNRVPREIPFQEFKSWSSKLPKEDVPMLFWLAVSWGSYIHTALDDTQAIGDIPYVETLIKQVVQLDEEYEHGSGHLFLGVFYSAFRATGEKEEARQHFEKALQLTKGELYSVHVAYARSFATAFKEKQLFEKLLEQVTQNWENRTANSFNPQFTLSNAIAYNQAQLLRDKIDDLFPSLDSNVEESKTPED